MSSSFDFSNRVYALAAVAVGSLLLVGVAVVWSVFATDTQYDQISVDGDATIKMTPDVAYVNISIVTEEDESAAALNENNTNTNEVLAAISNLGIADENVRTYGYYLYPSYEWVNDEYKEVGYEANQSIEITIKDFELLGELISVTSAAGANRFNGVNFELENYEEELEAAREEAVAEARAKADSIAKTSGAKIGKLTSYYEYTDDYDYGKGGVYDALEYSMAEAEAIAPEIKPGQEEITLTVSLSFRLK